MKRLTGGQKVESDTGRRGGGGGGSGEGGCSCSGERPDRKVKGMTATGRSDVTVK